MSWNKNIFPFAIFVAFERTTERIRFQIHKEKRSMKRSRKGPWKGPELLFYSVLFYCSIERATVLFIRIGYSFRAEHWYRSTFSFHFNSCLSCPYQWANIYNHFPLKRIKWVWEAGMCPACYSWSVQKNGTGDRWLARHTLT